jgi:hypothetical protein
MGSWIPELAVIGVGQGWTCATVLACVQLLSLPVNEYTLGWVTDTPQGITGT